MLAKPPKRRDRVGQRPEFDRGDDHEVLAKAPIDFVELVTPVKPGRRQGDVRSDAEELLLRAERLAGDPSSSKRVRAALRDLYMDMAGAAADPVRRESFLRRAATYDSDVARRALTESRPGGLLS